MKYDEIHQWIGSRGSFQVCVYLITYLINVLQSDPMVLVFANAEMPHWCKVPQLENFSYPLQKSIAIPPGDDDESSYSSCQMYALNYSSFSRDDFLNWNRSERIDSNTQIVDCDDWIYEQTTFISTSVSRFGLVCSKAYLNPLISTVFMCGFLVGGLTSGPIADRFGRKRCCFGFFFVRLAGMALCICSINYSMDVFGRFVLGIGAAGLLLSVIVLTIELCPLGQMNFWMITSSIFACLGYLLHPAVSYFVRDSTRYQLAVMVPNVFLFFHLALIPESIRWLIVREKHEEASSVIRRYIAVNGLPTPSGGVDTKRIEMESRSGAKKAGCSSLVQNSKLGVRTLIVVCVWFTTCLTYYGLLLNVGTFSGSIYVNTVVSMATEIPAKILIIFVFSWKPLGRRRTNVALFLLMALSTFLCIPLTLYDLKEAVTGMAMVGKCFATMSFTIIYLYTIELFPTEIRSVAIGCGSVSSRLGGMLAPFMGTTLMNVWKPLPYVIYGVLSAIVGCLSFLLPETLGQPLMDTLEEFEMRNSKGISDFKEPNAVLPEVINGDKRQFNGVHTSKDLPENHSSLDGVKVIDGRTASEEECSEPSTDNQSESETNLPSSSSSQCTQETRPRNGTTNTERNFTSTNDESFGDVNTHDADSTFVCRL